MSLKSINNTIPKSRVTITYDMDVEGVEKRKELPFKQLVVGDFSLDSSNEKKQDLSNRSVYEITNTHFSDVMKNMGIKLDIAVPNHVARDQGDLGVKLDIESMKSFDPNQIAQNIPELAVLLKAKHLIKEFGSQIDNNRKLRNYLNTKLNSNKTLLELKENIQADETFKFDA